MQQRRLPWSAGPTSGATGAVRAVANGRTSGTGICGVRLAASAHRRGLARAPANISLNKGKRTARPESNLGILRGTTGTLDYKGIMIDLCHSTSESSFP